MADSMQQDELPGYFTLLSDVFATAQEFLKGTHKNVLFYPSDFLHDLWRYAEITFFEILFVTCLAVIMTLLRYSLTKRIFAPFAKYVQMTPINAKKFPESAWKVIYYSCTWAFCLWLLIFSGKYDYFFRPLQIWTDWEPRMQVPIDIRITYAVQFAFYMHSVYATVYMDQWRKDSMVMIFHHFLTMALIGFSYAVRYHKIGMIVLLLHDVTDVILEPGKCCIYMKDRGGKYYPIYDYLASFGFILFSSSWFIFRLYWYPLKVLHSGGHGVVVHNSGYAEDAPFYIFFNIMLWILQGLNVYWFMFILNLMYKVATGQMKEVDDVREEEVLAKHSPKDGELSEDESNSKPVRHENGSSTGSSVTVDQCVNGNGSISMSNGTANHHNNHLNNSSETNHHSRLKHE